MFGFWRKGGSRDALKRRLQRTLMNDRWLLSPGAQASFEAALGDLLRRTFPMTGQPKVEIEPRSDRVVITVDAPFDRDR
jgi:hypothetical protein